MKSNLTSKKFFFIFLTISIIIGFTAADKIDFYYFFPDSSQSNLGNLKKGMDTYFVKKNAIIEFQPFLRLPDLSRKVKDNVPEFIFVPEWHLNSYAAELGLKPILIPSRNGRTFYHKVLMVKKDAGINLKNMKEKNLALTSMGPMSDQILNEILFSDYNIDARNVKKIKVSKDSDAIFALALGQVDMAFVVKENLKKIEKISPMIVKNLVPLIESKPVSMPVLCCFENRVSLENIEKMKRLFLSKESSKELDEIKGMLQIDEWLPYVAPKASLLN